MPQDISSSRRNEMLHQAIAEKFGKESWLSDTFGDYCVMQQEGHYYKVPYTLSEDGASVELGDRGEEVKLDYVPAVDSTLSASMSLTAAKAGSAADGEGSSWAVRVIEFGLDKQGTAYYTPGPMRAAKGLYDGARVFMLTESQHEEKSKKFGKSAREAVGWIDNVHEVDDGFNATLHIAPSAEGLRKDLVFAWANGKQDYLGLSHDIGGKVSTRLMNGKKVKYLEEVSSVEVDVVYDPIGGGRFIQMVAAGSGGKDDNMIHRLLAALETAKPDEYKKLKASMDAGVTVTEDEVLKLLGAAPQAADPPAPGQKIEQLAAAASKEDVDGLGKEVEQLRAANCATLLRAALAESGLPDLAREKLRAAFTGQVFEEERLTAAIKGEKEYLDKLTGAGRPQGEFGNIEVVYGSGEKLQAAFDKMLGVDVDKKFDDVPRLEGLRAAYVRMTGDQSVSGNIAPERLTAAQDSTSFAVGLGNSMYRRMVQEYKAIDYMLDRIISNERNAKDFRTIEAVNIGLFGDLPDVDPEAADYTEIASVSEEAISYALNQKGVILTVTRKMIINDDLNIIGRQVRNLTRAAARTKAKRAWSKFISNATYTGDSKAVFHADHGNLGTTALAKAALVTRLSAMYAQTEPGSGEVLGIRGKTLAVPQALEATAFEINNPGYAAAANAMYHRFGVNNEDIIVVPFMTDATDWMIFADPREVEILEVAYLNGQREPEMFVANLPNAGQAFTADKIQYKVRDEYEFAIMDFRGADKSVVAG